MATRYYDRSGVYYESWRDNPYVGSCLYLRDEERYIFYPIIKRQYGTNDVPDIVDVRNAIALLARRCFLFNLKRVAIQFNEDNMNGLDWNLFKETVLKIFAKQFKNFEIDIYQEEEEEQQ